VDTEHADGVLARHRDQSGTCQGRARTVKSLSDIGTIEHGEILVCNSRPRMDTGVRGHQGIVLRDGAASHGSCLAREYGMPAVQLPSAMKLIPDGAEITVNGDIAKSPSSNRRARGRRADDGTRRCRHDSGNTGTELMEVPADMQGD